MPEAGRQGKFGSSAILLSSTSDPAIVSLQVVTIFVIHPYADLAILVLFAS